MISSGGVVLPGLRASGCLVLPVSRRHASWGRWWIVSGMGGRREPWAWLALLGCVVRASAFVMSGFPGFGAGLRGGGLFPHYTKSHPVYSLPRLSSCCCIVHGLYNLLVCVCVLACFGVRGIVGSCQAGGMCRAWAWWAWWGGGEKGKNSGGGCDNERKSSTPHMSDLNRAALGYPTTEFLVA